MAHPHSVKRRENSKRGHWGWLAGNFDVTKEADFDTKFGERDKVVNLWHDDTQVTHSVPLFT